MTTKSLPGRTAPRDKGVELPGWWLAKVNELARGYTLTKLGGALAVAVGRDKEWDHSAVSRFLDGKVTTLELADAFSVLFNLPRPYYKAESLDEAIELQGVAQSHATPADLAHQQQRRLAALNQLRDAQEKATAHQTRGLHSDNEGVGTGRRARRSGRIRKAPPRA